jgi:hypothetical protein
MLMETLQMQISMLVIMMIHGTTAGNMKKTKN